MAEKKKPARLVARKKDRSQALNDLMNLLVRQGFTPQEESEVGIHFQFEGETYYIAPQNDDNTFSQLLYPNFWSLESEDEIGCALFACDLVNRKAKLVKLHTADDDVWANIESLHDSPADFVGFLPQYLRFIQESVRVFGEVMVATADREELSEDEA